MSFTPGPAKQADIAALQRRWAPFCDQVEQTTCLVTDLRPNTVSNYAAIDATPAVLAAVLAVLGLGVLAQFTSRRPAAAAATTPYSRSSA